MQENIGAMQITGVGSRRVIQLGACVAIVFGLIGKVGGLFASMPRETFVSDPENHNVHHSGHTCLDETLHGSRGIARIECFPYVKCFCSDANTDMCVQRQWSVDSSVSCLPSSVSPLPSKSKPSHTSLNAFRNGLLNCILRLR